MYGTHDFFTVQAALGHYSTCKEGGGSYVGVYFNAVGEEDPAGAGYARRGNRGALVH